MTSFWRSGLLQDLDFGLQYLCFYVSTCSSSYLSWHIILLIKIEICGTEVTWPVGPEVCNIIFALKNWRYNTGWEKRVGGLKAPASVPYQCFSECSPCCSDQYQSGLINIVVIFESLCTPIFFNKKTIFISSKEHFWKLLNDILCATWKLLS